VPKPPRSSPPRARTPRCPTFLILKSPNLTNSVILSEGCASRMRSAPVVERCPERSRRTFARHRNHRHRKAFLRACLGQAATVSRTYMLPEFSPPAPHNSAAKKIAPFTLRCQNPDARTSLPRSHSWNVKICISLHLKRFFSARPLLISMVRVQASGFACANLESQVTSSSQISPGGSYVSTQRNRPAPRTLHTLISSRLRQRQYGSC
jgi:hypothetical protein